MGLSASGLEEEVAQLPIDDFTTVPAPIHDSLLMAAARARLTAVHVKVADANGVVTLRRRKDSVADAAGSPIQFQIGDLVLVTGDMEVSNRPSNNSYLGLQGRITRMAGGGRRFQIQGLGATWLEEVELQRLEVASNGTAQPTFASRPRVDMLSKDAPVEQKLMDAGLQAGLLEASRTDFADEGMAFEHSRELTQQLLQALDDAIDFEFELASLADLAWLSGCRTPKTASAYISGASPSPKSVQSPLVPVTLSELCTQELRSPLDTIGDELSDDSGDYDHV